MLAELILLLLLVPLGVVVFLALADIFLMPGLLSPSSWGRQFLRWVGDRPCVSVAAIAASLVWVYLLLR